MQHTYVRARGLKVLGLLPRGILSIMDIIGTIDSEDEIDIQDGSDSEEEFKMDIESSNEGIYRSCRFSWELL